MGPETYSCISARSSVPAWGRWPRASRSATTWSPSAANRRPAIFVRPDRQAPVSAERPAWPGVLVYSRLRPEGSVALVPHAKQGRARILFDLRRAARSTEMTHHKFRIGERVELIPSLSERFAATGMYEVARQLPTTGGEFGYR